MLPFYRSYILQILILCLSFVSSGRKACKTYKGKFSVVGTCTSALYALACLPGHGLLVFPVSQFTLFAQVKKGNKPDFHGAADATKAKELYEHFYSKVGDLYQRERVKDGVFQAMMDVGLVNDGPVCRFDPHWGAF